MSDDLVKRLRDSTSWYHADCELKMKCANRIEELQHEVALLRKSLSFYEKERERFRHANPEMTGAFFISGKLGNVDDNGLPEKIEVCPSYGCAWVQIYEKTDKTISYEGS